jgi:acetolactate synthase-1/3 small subunit
MVWAILSIKVENKPGILFKVTHLFRSRNFNIDSISVGVTEDKKYSRMTITTIGDEKQILQIVKQLDKMIDTIEVHRLDVNNSVYRELVMFKIKVNKPEDSMEINKLASAYSAKIHDAKKESIIVEMTATPHQITAFEELAKKFGLKEMARTGITALEREEHEH